MRGTKIAHHRRPPASSRETSSAEATTSSEFGASIIEATFTFLAFFVLVIAVFEGGMYMKDDLAVSSTVRAGARAASATGNESRADLYTVVNIARESTALNRRDIVRIVIYKPAGFGEEPSTSCMNGIPVANVCNVYTATEMRQAEEQVKEEAAALAQNRAPDPSKIVFGCVSSASPDADWCPTSRKVSPTGVGPEYVGVWMRVEHAWITKLFGNAKTIEDRSIIRLEPRSDS